MDFVYGMLRLCVSHRLYVHFARTLSQFYGYCITLYYYATCLTEIITETSCFIPFGGVQSGGTCNCCQVKTFLVHFSYPVPMINYIQGVHDQAFFQVSHLEYLSDYVATQDWIILTRPSTTSYIYESQENTDR